MVQKQLLLIFSLYFLACNAQVVGLWYWTWSTPSNTGAINLGIAFSGWVDPDSALSNSAGILSSLPGTKFLGLGGGNSNGYWTSALVSKVSSYCSTQKFSGYQGIAFDIEEGDAGIAGAFASTFAACKAAGYQVLVTTSHSAPYGISDGVSMMTSFVSNGNIDYISPQLYTSGTESTNDYSTIGMAWNSYIGLRAKFVPSLVTGSYYPSAQSYFAGVGITTAGFIQWSQTVSSAGGSSPGGSTASTVRCGTDWASANSACGTPCTTNNDCSGQYCYASLSTVPCGSQAVSESSNSFSSQTSGTTAITPLAIGLISTICVLVVIVIVLSS